MLNSRTASSSTQESSPEGRGRSTSAATDAAVRRDVRRSDTAALARSSTQLRFEIPLDLTSCQNRVSTALYSGPSSGWRIEQILKRTARSETCGVSSL